MQWLSEPLAKPLEKIKEEDNSTTLDRSTDPSVSQEQSMESLSETTESTQDVAPVEMPACTLDTAAMDITSGGLRESDALQTSAERVSLEMDTTSGGLNHKSQEGEIDLEDKDELQSAAEEINLQHNIQDKSVASGNEIDSSMKTGSLEHLEDRNLNEQVADSCSTEMSSEQTKESSVETSNDSICHDDVILSSSQNPGLSNDDLALPGESEQFTSTEPSMQMYSTPKLRPYQDVEGEHVIEMDKEGYREGISRDSGIHESKEDVDEDTGDHRWVDQHDAGEFPCQRLFLRAQFYFCMLSSCSACSSFIFCVFSSCSARLNFVLACANFARLYSRFLNACQ